jgi:hypothetical protein
MILEAIEMKKCDKRENKIYILIVSSILTGILILLFFLDDSLEWNSFKIYSCIIVSLWVFFIIPAVRDSYLLNKGKSLSEWFIMGFRFGASGIAFPILLAPYYGVKYYFNL